MQTATDRTCSVSEGRPSRAQLRRKRAVAQTAAALLRLRDEHGDSAVEDALEEARRQELRDCPPCNERTPHRDGLCLTCGAWN